MSEKIELLRQNSLSLKRQIAAQQLKIKQIKDEQKKSIDELEKITWLLLQRDEKEIAIYFKNNPYLSG